MTKKEVATQVAKETGLTNTKTEGVINAFLTAVRAEVNNGGTVYLKGFGNFKKVERAARRGFNPQTNEPMDIPAKNVAKFSPAKDFIN